MSDQHHLASKLRSFMQEIESDYKQPDYPRDLLVDEITALREAAEQLKRAEELLSEAMDELDHSPYEHQQDMYDRIREFLEGPDHDQDTE